MTAPLTPPDCDLQDFPFMPLHVARLRDSDLASEEAPEACWYAVLLWAASWHQIPAASLPDNDAVLTRLIGLGRDVKTFRKHRSGALRGFTLCDDGRLYHPVVAEQALESWRRKLEQRWRTECGRIKKANQRNGTEVPMPTLEAFLSRGTCGGEGADVPRDAGDCPSGQSLQGTGIGTETGTSTSVSNETGAEAPSTRLDDLADLRALEPRTGAWRLAVKVLMDRGGYPQARARTLVGKWAKETPPAELWKACEAAWRSGTLDPVSYITAALERIAEDERDPLRHPSEVRQRLWMQDFRDHPADWREHERGAKPGETGCRISPEIQREFDVEPAKPQPVRVA